MEVYHSQTLSNFSLLINVEFLCFVLFECRGHLYQYYSCRVASYHTECQKALTIIKAFADTHHHSAQRQDSNQD